MRPARIGIDARFYGLGSAGLARYTQELIAHLAQLETPHTFVAFLRDEDLDEFSLRSPNLEVRTTRTPHYSVREQLFFKRELQAATLDLMHFTNFNFPLSYRDPFVISINDLTLLHFAGRSRTSRFKTRPMRFVMQQGANRSLSVLTYSRHQKDLITENFNVDPGKVEVIYLAVDEQFRPSAPAEVAAFRKRKKLEGPFMMYTGQWREHKNLVRLFKAFARIKHETAATLVLVGKEDRAFPIIPRTVKELGLEDRVVFTGFVEDDDLPLYYAAADLFVFPSLSEGFGLPPLEAMACGTTVASSSAPPMPEILGDAAVYFDPNDTEDMARVLVSLLGDAQKREAYREQGFAQTKRYSWEQTATQTYQSYETALRRLRRK